MRRVAFLFMVVFAMSCHAQTQSEMRDSLAAAVKELAFHPDSIDLRLKKAAWNVQLHQWEYAREEYDYVLKKDKANIAALYYRAFVNEKLGRLKFARLDYQNMLTIVPGNFEAQLGLALLNQKDKHRREALDLLNNLCDRYPGRSEAFAARAGVEMERKMYDLAVYDYSRAIELEPKNMDYRLSRADAYIKQGKKAEARKDLDELVRMGLAKPALSELYNKTK